MMRGDAVTIGATGDYGKPRPSVIVQTDALPVQHVSVVVCRRSCYNGEPGFVAARRCTCQKEFLHAP
jgi:mRNA-degrading endonuclease toxin of MazEF toxin-antitoxin module